VLRGFVGARQRGADVGDERQSLAGLNRALVVEPDEFLFVVQLPVFS
jgi:hypothetical protein